MRELEATLQSKRESRLWTKPERAPKSMAFACVALLVLMGCTSAEERARRDDERTRNLAMYDSATCQSYGFEPGTTDFAYCRLKLGEIRAKADAATTRNYSSGASNASLRRMEDRQRRIEAKQRYMEACQQNRKYGVVC